MADGVFLIGWLFMFGIGFPLFVFYQDHPFPFPQKAVKKYCIDCEYRTEINSHLNICERPTEKFNPVTGEYLLIYKIVRLKEKIMVSLQRTVDLKLLIIKRRGFP